MNDKITNVNLDEFLNDHLKRSEIILLEESKEADDIMSVAKARGYILEGSNDLAGFKTIYTFDTKANINRARLPKELLLKALPGIIGKPVDIDHNRIYVVGHYIDYRYVASKNMVIAYGVFYKSNFGEEWEKAKQLFKAGKLGTSYEIWCSKSKRKYLPDGTYVLTSIEIAGGGLMFKEKPAFPDAKVLELAMKHIDEHTSEIMTASSMKNYEASEMIFAAGYNYDAKVGNVKKTATPTSDKLYQADELIGQPVSVQLPSPLKAKDQGFEKPVVGLPNPTHTTVGLPPNPGKSAPGSLVDLQEKNALKNTGLQPDRIKNDNLGDNVTQQGPQFVASITCQNCKKNFNFSAQTFQRKNSIDFYEVAKTDDMHQCPNCKGIVDRQGYMLHPPQIVDFSMACPGCNSNNWRILTNGPEETDVSCMNCAKNYHLQFEKDEVNPLRSRLLFMRSGYSTCPQCRNTIPYSTFSNVEKKELTCPKCNLHYAINMTKGGMQRKIFKANEFLAQYETEKIGDGSGGTGKEQAAAVPVTAAKDKSNKTQPVVIRPNQGITDNMAAKQRPAVKQSKKVDNKLTKNLMTNNNLKTDPNKPMNEGSADDQGNKKGALYIVRHGKTALNDHDTKKDNDRIRGWVNVPLDIHGRRQAKELGQVFKGQKIDKLYSSDLSRAHDTAKEIGKTTGVTPQAKFDLRPWNLGKYNGQSSKQVHPEIAKYATEKPTEKVEGGESFNNFKVRALNFARKLLKEAKDGKMVVAVTHTRVAKLIQAWIMAGCPDDNTIDNDEFMKDTVQTGSIHKLEPTSHGVNVTEENLQKSSISDNTTDSSEKGGSTMSQENQEVKNETPTTEAKTETVNTPTVEAKPVEAAETPAPAVEEESPIVDENPTEVEDAEAVEQEEALEVSKTLKAEDRNALPNQKFAVIKTVKDKKSGGTRTVRKYPIHDKAHVQNALSRLNQQPSRDGLRKLGVSPDAVIKKVKAAGKKMGMEVADMDGMCKYDDKMEKSEMEGYAVASKGRDMQKAVPRGKDNVQMRPESQPNNYVGASAETKNIEEAKKKVTGDESVQGLTPDQVNQMQNQLFSSLKKAKSLRKARKMTVKNIKTLQKALMDGVYASVQEVDVTMNMDFESKGKTPVSDRGTGEKPTESMSTGKAPVPAADCIVIDNDKVNAEAKEVADHLKPAAEGEKVDVIMAPAAPVENMEITSKGKETPVSNPDGEKVSGGTKDADAHATEVPSLSPVKEESITENANATVKTVTEDSKGSAAVVSEPAKAITAEELQSSSVEALTKEKAELEEKIKLLESAAVKLIERKTLLGDIAKGLSDKDILDDDKFEVLKVKAENKALKAKLNTASVHIAETTQVLSKDRIDQLADEIKSKANKLY